MCIINFAIYVKNWRTRFMRPNADSQRFEIKVLVKKR